MCPCAWPGGHPAPLPSSESSSSLRVPGMTQAQDPAGRRGAPRPPRSTPDRKLHRTGVQNPDPLWRANPQRQSGRGAGEWGAEDGGWGGALPGLGGLCPHDCENSPDHSGRRDGRDGPLLPQPDLGEATTAVGTVRRLPWSPVPATSRFEPLPGTWDKGPAPRRWPCRAHAGQGVWESSCHGLPHGPHRCRLWPPALARASRAVDAGQSVRPRPTPARRAGRPAATPCGGGLPGTSRGSPMNAGMQ